MVSISIAVVSEGDPVFRLATYGSWVSLKTKCNKLSEWLGEFVV